LIRKPSSRIFSAKKKGEEKKIVIDTMEEKRRGKPTPLEQEYRGLTPSFFQI
jgi:hypothetical protein